jgi:hypothetical protein
VKAAEAEMEKRDVSQKERKKLQGRGHAMKPLKGTKRPRYPIDNEQDLRNAQQAIGRTAPEKRPAVMAHIRSEAKRLGVPLKKEDKVVDFEITVPYVVIGSQIGMIHPTVIKDMTTATGSPTTTPGLGLQGYNLFGRTKYRGPHGDCDVQGEHTHSAAWEKDNASV